jgi:hypothetical protein
VIASTLAPANHKDKKRTKISPEKGQQVQIPVEHLPVKLRARQALPASLAENAEHHCGFLHCASLMALIRSSPVPLRPVNRH